MKHYDISSFLEKSGQLSRPYHEMYLAMYSSIIDGIITDPCLMTVPIDDHMVHRGDGVFETFKCVDGSVYNMRAHLERMALSAEGLGHELKLSLEEIESLVIETVRAGGEKECTVRLYLSRGPGSFDVNPYDCPEPQIYIVVTRLKDPFMTKHPEGATVKTSSVSQKDPFYATMKSCNYLVNVLMKKEAVDSGVDFVVAFDERGDLCEGATENFALVAEQGSLLFPNVEKILRGTTMVRVMELAEQLVKSGDLKEVAFADISKEDVASSQELFVLGTTPNVTAVIEFDGKPIGSGIPGKVYEVLSALLLDDIRNNDSILTRVF